MNDTWWVGLEQLDGEQAKVIELPIGKSYLISGPPGCGKTNLLLLRANYLHLAGRQNIQVVVFTRTLQEFIASGGNQYDFPVEKVKTSTKFFQDVLFQYGVDVTLPEDFDDRRRYLIDETAKLAKRAKLTNSYEAILLDEGHDYVPEEIALFGKLGRTLFITADPRQKIYTGDDSIEAIRQVVHAEYPLQFHYRIGRRICKVADALMKEADLYIPLEPSSQYDESAAPSRVELIQCGSVAEQMERIVESLTLQHKTYPDEMLGILCPTHDVLDEVRLALTNSVLRHTVTCQGAGDVIAFGPDKKIAACTIHAAKGLEFRTVHVAGAEAIKKFPHQRRMAFTAVTRAKTSLSIYHSQNLPGYLEQALQAVQAPRPLPKVAQVFGRKK